ncbi:hypothetical protein BGZ76_005022, partial [Entomortierella beljakovae]
DSKLTSIEEGFYSEDWSEFIKAYISGSVKLPVTDGAIPGFPLAWRRGDKDKGAATHRPSLLFFDLPDLDGSYLNNDSNHKAKEILSIIAEKNHSSYPIFGASGCGKTRTVMDMLSLNWGFYFNGSRDDRGSADVDALIRIVSEKIIKDDPLRNNMVAKSITTCLLFARLSILTRCLSASEGKMTPSQWMLLQVCPQVLGEVHWNDSKPFRTDLFLALFERLESSLSNHGFLSLNKLLQDRFDTLTKVLSEQYQCNSKFLLVLDEAQRLGGALQNKFQTEEDGPSTKRPILSPFFHGLEELSSNLSQICLVPCGTGLCIYDIKEVGGSLKVSESPSEVLDSPMFKRAGSFPRWDDQAKVKAYFETLDLYLKKQGYSSSASKLKELINDQVFEMLYAWFRGRLRPMISVIEDVIRCGDTQRWKESTMTQISVLTDPKFEESGNLCFEISRIIARIADPRGTGVGKIGKVREILSDAVKKRLQYGGHCELNRPIPILVEASFARIVNDKYGDEVTIIDEPIAFQAAINFIEIEDPGLLELLGDELLQAPTPGTKGTYLEYFSPALLIPVFHENKLAPALFKIKAKGNVTLEALRSKEFSIAGYNTGLRGIRHEHISLNDFLDAHCNRDSVHNSELVPPFFFPKENPSGPDIVFVLESEGQYYPVFVQSKISNHVDKAKGGIKHAHDTTCYDCIKAHLPESSLAKYCSKDIFLSLLLIPYHEQGRYSVAKDSAVVIDNEKSLKQYTMVIDKNNRDVLLPEEVLEFLENAKEPLQKYAFTDEDNLGIVSKSNKRRAVEEPARLNKRKPVEPNVEGSDEESPSESKKRRVSKPAVAPQAIIDNKTIKSGRLTKRRTPVKLPEEAQVLKDKRETRPGKRGALELTQTIEENELNGPRR